MWLGFEFREGFDALELIDANVFAAADESGRISLWDLRQQKPVTVFPPEMPGVASKQFLGFGGEGLEGLALSEPEQALAADSPF